MFTVSDGRFVVMCALQSSTYGTSHSNMHAFRWPESSHDIALAKEVAAKRPSKPADWEEIVTKLSSSFSTKNKPLLLKGRGCRERMDRLLQKYKADVKALKW